MMKILFVDDNELNRMVMEDMVEILFETVQIETYEKPSEVLELDLDGYALILSDIDMPLMNGFDLYTLLRDKHKYCRPIIAVTALAVNGDKEKILMHGFDNYISKPIDMNELEQTLQKYL